VHACTISRDGSFLLSASSDGMLRILDLPSGKGRAPMIGHAAKIRDCAISSDDSFAVSASEDGTLKIWDVTSGEERATLEGHAGPVFACAISPDGSFAFSAGGDRTVRLWDVASGRLLGTLPLEGAASSVTAHPRLPLVVCGDAGGTLHWLALVGIHYGPGAERAGVGRTT
jgi:WD40 repeat protein